MQKYGACIDSDHCMGNMRCMFNVTKDTYRPLSHNELLAINTSEGFCGCHPYYGFTGENCNQYTSGVYFIIFVTGLSLFIFFSLFIYAGRLVYHNYREKRFLKWTLADSTTALVTFTFLIYVLYLITRLVNFVTPDRYITVDTGKEPIAITPHRIFFATVVLLSIMASLNITLVWVRIAQSATKLALTKKYVQNYEKLVIFMNISGLIGVAILVLTKYLFFAGIILIPFALAIFILCITGSIKLRRLLNERIKTATLNQTIDADSKITESMERTSREILLASRGLMVGNLLFFVSGAVFTIVQSKLVIQVQLPFSYNANIIFLQLTDLSLLIVNVTLINYLGNIILGKRKRDSKNKSSRLDDTTKDKNTPKGNATELNVVPASKLALDPVSSNIDKGMTGSKIHSSSM